MRLKNIPYSRITAQRIFFGCLGAVSVKTVLLCFAVAVAYNKQIPRDCCADVTFFMVVGRRIMACTHLWKCLLNFVLRLFQVASGCFSVSSSLFHSISGRPAAPRTGFHPRSTNTHDRFNKPSGITNSAVNIAKTSAIWSFAQYFVFCNTDTYNNKTDVITILRFSCQTLVQHQQPCCFTVLNKPARFGWHFLRLTSTEQPHAFLTFHNVHSAVWSTFGAVMVRGVTVL